MPPKIMFRIFFYRMEDAQNDNAVGLGYVVPAALRRNPVDATPASGGPAHDDMPMPLLPARSSRCRLTQGRITAAASW